MILNCFPDELFYDVDIGSQINVCIDEHNARVQCMSRCGEGSVLSIELPASLLHCFCLLQRPHTNIKSPKVTEQLGQGNLRSWVAIVKHRHRFFKSLDPF